MKKRFAFSPVTLAVLAVILGCIAYWAEVDFLDQMELKTVDIRFRYRGAIAGDPRVVLAVIDEKSLDREGKWVWPRTKMAALVDALSGAGARVVAFDIGFLEPDNRQILETVRTVESAFRQAGGTAPGFEAFLADLKTRSDPDRMLAEAIRRSRARVVLGYFFHMDPAGVAHRAGIETDRQAPLIANSAFKLVHFASPGAERTPLITAAAPEANIPVISDAAEFAGFFNMFPDPDGVVRWIPSVIKFRDTLYAPLSLMALSAYLDEPLSARVDDIGVVGVGVGSRRIPTDETGRILINYHGPVRTFDHISITDILNGQADPSRLKESIVLVGATAVGIYDLRVTPFGSVFPGLEIHANVISSVLSQRYMYQPGWSRIFDTLAIGAAGLAIGVILSRLGAFPGALAAVGLFAAYIGACQYLFSHNGWVLNLVYPLTVLVLTYTGITGFKYFSEARQKKFIRDAFSTYLAPTVVKQLIDSPESLNLGGEERSITAFFSDVEGFTGISERLAPADLVELLNNFLTEMTDIILVREGTVDKFEGDAIIAFFGAPNTLENHAEVACLACLDMQQRLRGLRSDWKAHGWPELKMRIGLCSGSAVVGNMGSKNRMDYTMMGDTVNTAARLEGVNKTYGTYTLVGESTYDAAKDRVWGREIDTVHVVGKKEPVIIYELLCYCDQAAPRLIQLSDLYARGLSAYRKRDWQPALKHFMNVLKIESTDGPARAMAMRCRHYLDTPPPDNWNGAFTIGSK